MLISPPFLPERAADQTDAQWLAAAMPEVPAREGDGPPEGAFPLGRGLSWHNGVHVQAPRDGEAFRPVTAIADGRVVFVNPPTVPEAAPEHAQNYGGFGDGPTWTDNGCVVVEHATTIGAGPVWSPSRDATVQHETSVVYYSVCMHLASIAEITPPGERVARRLRAGDSVWRKDEIGRPGRIYGREGQIHFEICLDTANLRRLTGRFPDWADPEAPVTAAADGRIDSVFGSLWFYLPATTACDAGEPMPGDHRRPLAPRTTLGTAIWVRMTYERGACRFDTFDLRGGLIGEPRTDAEGEYRLYDEATGRHRALPDADRALSSPSGWYELLRFGRNLGRGPGAGEKDPLPADVAHWRRIVGPDGRETWADLNAPGSFKLSDADFPAVAGWTFVDDDATPDDQRCDSEHMTALVRDPDPSNARRLERDELARRLSDEALRRRLRRVVCRFPSEWDRATIAGRYAFVRELPAFQADPQGWPRLEAHMQAMSFDNLPAGYLEARWNVHPGEFMEHARTNGWLSAGEMGRVLHAGPAGSASRIAPLRVPMLRCMRKYAVAQSPQRMAHFLAQIAQETGWWLYRRERGYERYFRTAYEVVTAEEAAEDFISGVALQFNWVRESETVDQYAARRPGVVTAKAIALGNGIVSAATGGQIGDGPRFRGRGLIQLTGRNNYASYGRYRGAVFTTDGGSESVSENDFNVVDTAGFFWARERINEESDEGSSAATVDRVGGLVNRGSATSMPLHARERRAYFTSIYDAIK